MLKPCFKKKQNTKLLVPLRTTMSCFHVLKYKEAIFKTKLQITMVVNPTFQVISMLAPFSIVKWSPGVLVSFPVSWQKQCRGKGFNFNSRLQSIVVTQIIRTWKQPFTATVKLRENKCIHACTQLTFSIFIQSKTQTQGIYLVPLTDVQAFPLLLM